MAPQQNRISREGLDGCCSNCYLMGGWTSDHIGYSTMPHHYASSASAVRARLTKLIPLCRLCVLAAFSLFVSPPQSEKSYDRCWDRAALRRNYLAVPFFRADGSVSEINDVAAPPIPLSFLCWRYSSLNVIYRYTLTSYNIKPTSMYLHSLSILPASLTI